MSQQTVLVDSRARRTAVHMATGDRISAQRSRVAAALLILGAVAAADVAALGLGKMTVNSRLGSGFQGEVELLSAPDDGRYTSDCFRLGQPVDVEAGLPVLTGATVTIERRDKRTLLLIRSAQPVNEPVLQINLRAGCGAEVARNYTLIIDPPEVAMMKPEVPSASASARPQTRVEPRPTPAIAQSRVTGEQSPEQWQAVEGETAQSIANNLFPRQPRAQRRFVRALQKANPQVDLGTRGEAPLSAGQSLRIPDSRQVVSAPGRDSAVRQEVDRRDDQNPPSAKKEKPRALPPATLAAEKTTGGMSDRLSLSGTSPDDERETGEWSLRLSTELSYGKINTTTESQRSILRLEYKLLAAIYDQANQQLSLAEQVRQLEGTIAELRVATESSLGPKAGSVAPPSGDAPPARAVPAGNAPQPAHKEEVPLLGSSSSWTWLLALLAVVGLLFLFLRRSTFRVARGSDSLSAAKSVEAEPYPPVELPPHTESGKDVSSSEGESKRSEPTIGDTLILEDRSGSKGQPAKVMAAPDSQHGTTAVIEHYEFDPVMELTEIMLAFGRVKGATEALQEYINAHPDGAIQPWMKLVEIYQQNDMRSEYEALAPQFAAYFNVLPAPWEALPEVAPVPVLTGNEEAMPIDQLLAHTPDTAAIPEIREAIIRQWGTVAGMQETLTDLNSLLRDKTNAVHQGLSLSMVNEILFLQTVLGKRLESASR